MANLITKAYLSDKDIREVIIRYMGTAVYPVTILEHRLWSKYAKENSGEVWFKDESKDWFTEAKVELEKRKKIIIKELKGYIEKGLKENK